MTCEGKNTVLKNRPDFLANKLKHRVYTNCKIILASLKIIQLSLLTSNDKNAD